ncbi:Autoinducer 2 sensor kinase/phosphatase LuxQ [BD1-7 clade bacterium]|uniref:histidine kinase n=1 Tax=BD1-7 clade bacterium TaxID=2029982 RepID=A0A5S9PJT2_9GAMM|nr:Autoinducer 2 sensor kinase/phosphatase LuxQ [BD1-7 clade bacterium]CAA0104160.1 Autoinducer 2 sensor kinase/phosphatase LuxQ [BD1-7 clade bacterium]
MKTAPSPEQVAMAQRRRDMSMKPPVDDLFDVSVIPTVIGAIANTRGSEFFYSITNQLAQAIGSDITFIGRIRGSTITTLSAYRKHTRMENFHYDVANGPCEKVTDQLESEVCTYTRNVAELFPADGFLIDHGIEGYIGMPLYGSDGSVLGLITALYQEPIEDPEKKTAIFQVFAGRIAAEIENTEKEAALQQLNNCLRASLTELNEYKGKLEEKVDQRTQELYQAKLHAEAQFQAQNAFLATLAHEIRTPMNGILGMATLLKDADFDATQQMYLDTIQRSGDTLINMVNDILDFTKSDSDRLHFEKAEFHLEDFLKSATAPFYAGTDDQLEMNVNISPGLPVCVVGDQTRLYQVLNNLIGNAFKFTEKGTITLDVSSAGFKDKNVVLQFSVSDTGIGIPDNKQRDIFEPFVQAEDSTTRKYGGTGLGLAICKKVVERAGGELTLESTPGKGSTFCFTMPFEIGESQREPSYKMPYIPLVDGDQQTAKVLLVDDNPVNVIVAVGLMNKLGISPDVAHNGQEAIDKVCTLQASYDLVLMDCEMPGIDGFQATETIRKWESDEGKHPVDILAFTANKSQKDQKRYELAGMNGAMSKPVNVDELSQRLQAI